MSTSRRAQNHRRKPMMAAVLVLATLATTEAGVFPTADQVIVEKSKRKLHLLDDGEAFRTFDIALGIHPPTGCSTPHGEGRRRPNPEDPRRDLG